jgi:flagellar biogenesis protein FliO
MGQFMGTALMLLTAAALYLMLQLARRRRLGKIGRGGVSLLQTIQVTPRGYLVLVQYENSRKLLGIGDGAFVLLDQSPCEGKKGTEKGDSSIYLRKRAVPFS